MFSGDQIEPSSFSLVVINSTLMNILSNPHPGGVSIAVCENSALERLELGLGGGGSWGLDPC